VDLELVVAHHEESLRWLRRVPPDYRRSIYHKGSGPLEGAIALPNAGREAHTYLYHIVQRYDSLAPVTVFCQGHPFDHASDFHYTLKNLAEGTLAVRDFSWLGFIIDTDDARGKRLFVNWSKNAAHQELELDLLYENLFGKTCPDLFHFYVGAQFIATKQAILGRPREFYEKALKLSVGIENAAHGFERIWDGIFGVRGVDPAVLAGNSCAYLKPIKRLLGPP
jgi:hypothetical protein